jgi:Glycosyltransferase 61
MTSIKQRLQAKSTIDAALRGDWDAVVAASEGLPVRFTRAIECRIVGFLELGRANEAAAVAHNGLEQGLAPESLTRIASRLFLNGEHVLASQILLAMYSGSKWTEKTTRLAITVAEKLALTERSQLLEAVKLVTRKTMSYGVNAYANGFVLNRKVAAGYLVERESWFARVACSGPKVEAQAAEVLALAEKYVEGMARTVSDSVCRLDNVFVNAKRQIWSVDGTSIDAQRWPLPSKAECDALVAAGQVPVVEHAVQPGRNSKGVYHWLVEDLPTISWLPSDQLPSAKVLMNGASSAISKDSLELFGFATDCLHHTNSPIVFCKHLYIPPGVSRGISNLHRFSNFFMRARQRALDRYPLVGSKKILISRRDSNRRKLMNEDAFEAHFKALGYEAVLLSKLPFAEQVALVAGASQIVATHGAGLSHLVFASPDARVGEVIPAQAGHMSKRFNFGRISLSKGIDHAIWLEPINPVSLEWTVDIDACAQFFRQFMDA